MMKTFWTITTFWAVILFGASPAHAEPVSMEQAAIVAENWIAAIIAKKENWGGSETATVENIQPLTRNGKTIGYFCKVSPKGYIIVSMRRELAPVKAYSATSDLNPLEDDGMIGLLKEQMGSILGRLQQLEARRTTMQQSGTTGTGTVAEGLEIDYRAAWDSLERDPAGFMDESLRPTTTPKAGEEGADSDAGGDMSNYQEGDALLTSHWHQFPPYNNDCPYLGCTNTSNGRAVVGCVATAGAQLMRYWAWPPYGVGSPYSDTYDWPNMPDTATTGSSAAVQAAVAELSREIGIAVGMSYGCTASSANTYNMEDVYENEYRYDPNVYKRDRDDYSAVDWFEIMKAEFDYNRPVQYRITDHSIVGDGWQEIGATPVRQYHMVYGWTNAGNDTWYTLDTLTADPEGEEYLLENIRPAPYLVTLDGIYNRESFPYRYFYRDTWGSNGIFTGGQRIQFLPEVFVYGTGSSTPVIFQGSASYTSYLFTRGDLNRGIQISNDAGAEIRLYNGGGIKFY